MRFAYNTNGCANHRLDDAVALIAEAGYDGIALTLDHHHLDPFDPAAEANARALAARLDGLGLGVVIETGARYLLDPRRKHEPTLVNPSAAGRARRVDFLKRAIDLCAVLRGEAVSFFSGVPQPEMPDGAAREALLDGLAAVADHAAAAGVTVALEPEPGHHVATCEDFAAVAAVLSERCAAPLTMALDTGHCLVTGEREPDEAVRTFAPVLGTVAIEDMRRGVHEHLPFGRGDMDVPAVLAALAAVGFGRLVSVELSRESHRAHEAIPEAIAVLRAARPEAAPAPSRGAAR